MTRTNRFRPAARGLSTLEMVLCLPPLLLVMALMVNFAAVARWKVRAWSVARQAAWASRHPRSGATRPDYWWPAEATMGSGGIAPLAEPDGSSLNHPVVRGPLPGGTVVHDQVLDPSLGGLHGSAGLEQGFPFGAAMGPFRLDVREELLDLQWTHREMRLGSTYDRRIPVLYELAQADPAVIDAYVAAAVAIVYAPFRPDLFPLDWDVEFREYARRFVDSPTFPYRGRRPPDFHPGLHLPGGGRCTEDCRADPELVRSRVDELVDHIQGNRQRRVHCLAYDTSQGFIRLYQAVQDELGRRIQAVPPPTPAEVTAMQAEIDELQAKIDVLQPFLARLP